MLWLSTLLFAMTFQAPGPAITTIDHSSMSRVDEARQAVARTDADWASLWRQHAGDAPAPKVDFGASTVVAVFLGTRMTAGFDVQIVGTRRDGDALIVEWRESRPSRDTITAQVITSPAIIAAIPRFTGEIRFEKVDP